MTVGELRRRMSASELHEWRAYYELEPFGEWRADVRMAMMSSLIANINRDPQKRSKAFGWNDFMPTFGEPKPAQPRQSWQDQLAIVEMWNIALGGQDNRERQS